MKFRRALVLALILFCSCSGKKTAPIKTEELLIYNLKWRYSQEVKDLENFAEYRESKEPYCEVPHATLTKELKLKEMLDCVQTLVDPILLKYDLKREVPPYWGLNSNSDHPECIQKLFAKIPLPREIFYEGNSQKYPKGLECYSQRLPIDRGKFLDSRLPFYKTSLQVGLPFEQKVDSTGELETHLLSWILSVFWDQSQGGFTPVGVPEKLCSLCLGPTSQRPKDRYYWPKWPPK